MPFLRHFRWVLRKNYLPEGNFKHFLIFLIFRKSCHDTNSFLNWLNKKRRIFGVLEKSKFGAVFRGNFPLQPTMLDRKPVEEIIFYRFQQKFGHKSSMRKLSFVSFFLHHSSQCATPKQILSIKLRQLAFSVFLLSEREKKLYFQKLIDRS